MNPKVVCRGRALAAALLALLALASGPGPARAGAKAEHYDLVFTMARAAGYSHQEARVIASASWSMDENNDTIAFVPEREAVGIMTHLGKNLTRFNKDADIFVQEQIWGTKGKANFRYAAQGKTGHALGSDAARKAMRRFWLDQIARAKDATTRLVVTGMYLHFMVDQHVHPQEATRGHLTEGHAPDLAFNQPEKYIDAGTEVLTYLIKQNRKNVPAYFRTLLGVDEKGNVNAEKARAFSERVVKAIVRAYHDAGADNESVNVLDLSRRQRALLDESLRRQLGHELEGDFKEIPGGFQVEPYRKIAYESDGKGNLLLGGEWIQTGPKDPRWKGARIVDPVQAINDARHFRYLAAVREELIKEVKEWVDNQVILAVGTQVVLGEQAALLGQQLGVASVEAVKLAPARAGQLFRQGRKLYDEASSKVAQTAGVFREAAKGKSIHAIAQLKDRTYRLVKATQDGLTIYDRLSEDGGVVYTVTALAARTLAARASGIKLERAAQVRAALRRQPASLPRKIILTGELTFLAADPSGGYRKVDLGWARSGLSAPGNLNIVIPGLSGRAAAESVSNALGKAPGQERYWVLEGGQRGGNPKQGYFGKLLQPEPPADRAHVMRVNLADPRSVERVRELAARPSATVIVQMSLGQPSAPATAARAWTDRATWAARVTTTLAEAHRRQHPRTTVTVIGHGSGARAVAVALQAEQDLGRRIIDVPVVAAARDVKGLLEVKRRDAIIITSGSAGGAGQPPPLSIASRSGGAVRRQPAPAELARQGYRVIQVSGQSNPWTRVAARGGGGGGGNSARARPAARQVYSPDRTIFVYPKSGGKPVEMPRTTVANVLRQVVRPRARQGQAGLPAGRNGGQPRTESQRLHEAAKTLRRLGPNPKGGGISLNPLAEMPVVAREVLRAGYSSRGQCLYLDIKGGKRLLLPRLEPEVWRLAWQSSYQGSQIAELSIGGGKFVTHSGQEVISLHPPGRPAVYYLGRTQDNLLGLVLYRADVALGKLAFGSSAEVRSVARRASGFRSLPELYPFKYCDHPSSASYAGWDMRVFLHPARIEVMQGEGNHLTFAPVVWTVHFSQSGPAEEAFAAFFQAHFDDIARSKLGAPLAHLVPHARAIAVFRWLRENGIPFDADGLAEVPLTRVFTPRDAAVQRAPTLKQIAPRRRGMIFGPFGPIKIVRADGRATTLTYVRGLPARVRRYDGAVLEVVRDGLGTPVGLRVSRQKDGRARKQQAAYYFDPKLGLVLAENVWLYGKGQALTVLLGKQAVVYPEARPEETVAQIVARFAAEEVQP